MTNKIAVYPKPRPRPKPPGHLSAKTKKWWKNAIATWKFEEHDVNLLTAALECWDMMNAARKKVEAEGMTYQFRGRPVAHPLLDVIKEQKTLFVRIMRELNLSPDPPEDARLPRMETTRYKIGS